MIGNRGWECVSFQKEKKRHDGDDDEDDGDVERGGAEVRSEGGGAEVRSEGRGAEVRSEGEGTIGPPPQGSLRQQGGGSLLSGSFHLAHAKRPLRGNEQVSCAGPCRSGRKVREGEESHQGPRFDSRLTRALFSTRRGGRRDPRGWRRWMDSDGWVKRRTK